MPTTRSALRWLHPKRCINSGTSARRNEGLRLSCNYRLKHGLVQAQVRDDLLELAVRFLELAQSSEL